MNSREIAKTGGKNADAPGTGQYRKEHIDRMRRQFADRTDCSATGSSGISRCRIERFKKAFAAKWLSVKSKEVESINENRACQTGDD